MAFEKSWEAIPARNFATDGGTEGQVFLNSTVDFKVKQRVILKSNSQEALQLEVKRVLSNVLLLVGAPGNINNKSDISSFLVADSATIEALEQPRAAIPEKELLRAAFAEEPIVAWRNALVDNFGNYYTQSNPLPVYLPDGTSASLPIFSEGSSEITSPAATPIFTYTSLSDKTKIVAVRCTVSTPALVTLKINGLVKRQFWTSPLERNANFEYVEALPLVNGSVLSIEATVDRFIQTQYETFTSLEGFQS